MVDPHPTAAKPGERDWLIRMRVTYSNAWAFVEASSETEAREKALRMEWHMFEVANAEMEDWEIQSVEENK